MNGWYALHIRPKCEHLSSVALAAKGYEIYLPSYTPSRLGAARTARQLPLFPGYLFCRIGPHCAGRIVTTPGVISFVGYGRQPAVIPEAEIETVRTLVASELPREPWRFLPAGTMVRVEAGPLAGVCGVLLSQADGHRLVVSITLLQRSVAAELDNTTPVSVVPPGRELRTMAAGAAGCSCHALKAAS